MALQGDIAVALGDLIGRTFNTFKSQDEVVTKNYVPQALYEIGSVLGLDHKQISTVLRLDQLLSSCAPHQGVNFVGFQECVQQLLAHHETASKSALPALGSNGMDLSGTLRRAFVLYSKPVRERTKLVQQEEETKISRDGLMRLCLDANLLEPIGPLTSAQLDIIFVQYKPQDSSKLSYPLFLRALTAVGLKLKADAFVRVAYVGLYAKPADPNPAPGKEIFKSKDSIMRSSLREALATSAQMDLDGRLGTSVASPPRHPSAGRSKALRPSSSQTQRSASSSQIAPAYYPPRPSSSPPRPSGLPHVGDAWGTQGVKRETTVRIRSADSAGTARSQSESGEAADESVSSSRHTSPGFNMIKTQMTDSATYISNQAIHSHFMASNNQNGRAASPTGSTHMHRSTMPTNDSASPPYDWRPDHRPGIDAAELATKVQQLEAREKLLLTLMTDMQSKQSVMQYPLLAAAGSVFSASAPVTPMAVAGVPGMPATAAAAFANSASVTPLAGSMMAGTVFATNATAPGSAAATASGMHATATSGTTASGSFIGETVSRSEMDAILSRLASTEASISDLTQRIQALNATTSSAQNGIPEAALAALTPEIQAYIQQAVQQQLDAAVQVHMQTAMADMEARMLSSTKLIAPMSDSHSAAPMTGDGSISQSATFEQVVELRNELKQCKASLALHEEKLQAVGQHEQKLQLMAHQMQTIPSRLEDMIAQQAKQVASNSSKNESLVQSLAQLEVKHSEAIAALTQQTKELAVQSSSTPSGSSIVGAALADRTADDVSRSSTHQVYSNTHVTERIIDKTHSTFEMQQLHEEIQRVKDRVSAHAAKEDANAHAVASMQSDLQNLRQQMQQMQGEMQAQSISTSDQSSKAAGAATASTSSLSRKPSVAATANTPAHASDQSAAITALTSDLKDLRQQVQQLQNQADLHAASAGSRNLTPRATKDLKLSASVDDSNSKHQNAATALTVQQHEHRLQQLQQQIDDVSSLHTASKITLLDERITDLAQQLQVLQQQSRPQLTGTAGNAAHENHIATNLQVHDQKLSENESAVKLQAHDEKLAALTGEVQKLREQVQHSSATAATSDAQLASLKQDFDALIQDLLQLDQVQQDLAASAAATAAKAEAASATADAAATSATSAASTAAAASAAAAAASEAILKLQQGLTATATKADGAAAAATASAAVTAASDAILQLQQGLTATANKADVAAAAAESAIATAATASTAARAASEATLQLQQDLNVTATKADSAAATAEAATAAAAAASEAISQLQLQVQQLQKSGSSNNSSSSNLILEDTKIRSSAQSLRPGSAMPKKGSSSQLSEILDQQSAILQQVQGIQEKSEDHLKQSKRIKELDQVVQDAVKELQALQTTINAAVADQRLKIEDLDRLADKLQNTSSSMASKTDLETVSQAVAQHAKELQEMRDSLSAIGELRTAVAGQQSDLQAVNTTVSKQQSDLQDIREIASKHQADVEQMLATISTHDSRLAAIDAAVTAQDSRVAAVQSSVDGLKPALAAAGNSQALEQLSAMLANKPDKAELQTIKATLDGKADAAQLQELRSILSAKAEALDISKVQATLDGKADVSALESLQAAAQAKATATDGDRTTEAAPSLADASIIEELKAALADKADLSTVLEMKKTLAGKANNKSVKDLEKTVETQKSSIAAAMAAIESLESKTMASASGDPPKALAVQELEARIAAHATASQSVMETVAELKAAVESQEASNQSVGQAVADLRAAVDSHSSSDQSVLHTVEELRSELHSQTSSHTQTIEELRSSISTQLVELRSTVESHTSSISVAMHHMEDVRTQVSTLVVSDLHNSSKHQLEDSQSVQQLESEVTSLKSTIVSVASTMASMQHQLKLLQQQGDSMAPRYSLNGQSDMLSSAPRQSVNGGPGGADDLKKIVLLQQQQLSSLRSHMEEMDKELHREKLPEAVVLADQINDQSNRVNALEVRLRESQETVSNVNSELTSAMEQLEGKLRNLSFRLEAVAAQNANPAAPLNSSRSTSSQQPTPSKPPPKVTVPDAVMSSDSYDPFISSPRPNDKELVSLRNMINEVDGSLRKALETAKQSFRKSLDELKAAMKKEMDEAMMTGFARPAADKPSLDGPSITSPSPTFRHSNSMRRSDNGMPPRPPLGGSSTPVMPAVPEQGATSELYVTKDELQATQQNLLNMGSTISTAMENVRRGVNERVKIMESAIMKIAKELDSMREMMGMASRPRSTAGSDFSAGH